MSVRVSLLACVAALFLCKAPSAPAAGGGEASRPALKAGSAHAPGAAKAAALLATLAVADECGTCEPPLAREPETRCTIQEPRRLFRSGLSPP